MKRRYRTIVVGFCFSLSTSHSCVCSILVSLDRSTLCHTVMLKFACTQHQWSPSVLSCHVMSCFSPFFSFFFLCIMFAFWTEKKIHSLTHAQSHGQFLLSTIRSNARVMLIKLKSLTEHVYSFKMMMTTTCICDVLMHAQNKQKRKHSTSVRVLSYELQTVH